MLKSMEFLLMHINSARLPPPDFLTTKSCRTLVSGTRLLVIHSQDVGGPQLLYTSLGRQKQGGE